MLRRFAAKTFAPLLARTAFQICSLHRQQPACRAFIKPKGVRTMASATLSNECENIKELHKSEEWESYEDKLSAETPLLIEFFTKLSFALSH